MMINPWLSDLSGDYLDQPTDFINHVFNVASLNCDLEMYLCTLGEQMLLEMKLMHLQGIF